MVITNYWGQLWKVMHLKEEKTSWLFWMLRKNNADIVSGTNWVFFCWGCWKKKWENIRKGHKSRYIYCLLASWGEDAVVVHSQLIHLAPVEVWVKVIHGDGWRLRLKRCLRLDHAGAVWANALLGFWLSRIGLNADFLELPYLGIFVVDWWMSLFPLSFEALELLAVDLSSIVGLVVFFDFCHSFELLNYFLVVTSALSSSPIMEILLEGFEDFGGSK